MHVAVVAYEGFNELDVFAIFAIVNRASRVAGEHRLRAELTCMTARVRTMYGVEVAASRPLSFVREADAVVLGSGGMLGALDDHGFMSELRLAPERQLVASQCSGALVLAQLGLLRDGLVCTDALYRPHLERAGLCVLDQPFFAAGNVASAGGCLASAHLAAWLIARLAGPRVARETLWSVAPVGDEERYVSQVMASVERHLAV